MLHAGLDLHGQILKDESLGRACVVTPDNIPEVDTDTSDGLSLGKVAKTFSVPMTRVMDALLGEEDVEPEASVPAFLNPLCARSRDVHVRLGDWATKGYSLLVLAPPGGEAPRLMVLEWPYPAGALGPRLKLEQPLKLGTQVTLVGGTAQRNRQWPEFRSDRRVRRC